MRFREHPRRVTKWDAARRLRIALVHDNHSVWWTCISSRTVADLERKFDEGSVALVLYNNVGGILGDHKKLAHGNKRFYLYIQLKSVDEFVRVGLGDLGVQLVGSVPFSEIRHY